MLLVLEESYLRLNGKILRYTQLNIHFYTFNKNDFIWILHMIIRFLNYDNTVFFLSIISP